MHVTGLMPALYDTSLIEEYKRKGKTRAIIIVVIHSENYMLEKELFAF